jgi:hypothetical protein
MVSKINVLFLCLVSVVAIQSCGTCDCFDEPDYAYTFELDFKSYNSGMSINEFLSVRDSIGNPKNYQIKVYNNDTNFREDHFSWGGDGKGDSIVIFTLWRPQKKVTIDINAIGMKHEFTKFELEGNEKGRINCKCFTPTKKTVTMDDSINIDVLNSNIVIKKL